MAKNLHTLSVHPGSQTEHFRKGQGRGTGNGKTAGRGQKGQGAHSHTKKRDFEGGQMPLIRRIPKFGFKNFSRSEYSPVNIEVLNRFEDGTEVTPTLLISTGVVKDAKDGIKILGRGQLERKLTVKAHAFSKSASAAITAAGGTAEVIK